LSNKCDLKYEINLCIEGKEIIIPQQFKRFKKAFSFKSLFLVLLFVQPPNLKHITKNLENVILNL